MLLLLEKNVCRCQTVLQSTHSLIYRIILSCWLRKIVFLNLVAFDCNTIEGAKAQSIVCIEILFDIRLISQQHWTCNADFSEDVPCLLI